MPGRYSNSEKMLERALKIIPLGSQTLARARPNTLTAFPRISLKEDRDLMSGMWMVMNTLIL